MAHPVLAAGSCTVSLQSRERGAKKDAAAACRGVSIEIATVWPHMVYALPVSRTALKVGESIVRACVAYARFTQAVTSPKSAHIGGKGNGERFAEPRVTLATTRDVITCLSWRKVGAGHWENSR